MENKNIIYGLVDPRDELICYVGKSTIGLNRPLTHLVSSHSKKINDWVDELGQKGLVPNIIIIERISDEKFIIEREKYWIGYYKTINSNLLNMMGVKKKIIINDELYLPNIGKDYYKNIKDVRGSLKLSSKKLSDISGVTYATIRRMESGREIGIHKVMKLVEALVNYQNLGNV